VSPCCVCVCLFVVPNALKLEYWNEVTAVARQFLHKHRLPATIQLLDAVFSMWFESMTEPDVTQDLELGRIILINDLN
jgi:hypothetical protein